VTAPRAAPLVDIIGSVWIGGVATLVPPFLREGALDLDVVTERAPPLPGSPELRLKTTARGRAAGGGFEGEVYTVDGLSQRLEVKLTTENTGRWVDRPDAPAFRRPSTVALSGARTPAGRFQLSASGDIAGARVATAQPFMLSLDDDAIESGAADIAGPDIAPFAMLLGTGIDVQSPLPVQARVSLERDGGLPVLALGGRLANEAVQARLQIRSRSEISGEVTLDRLSLPWLFSALELRAPLEPGPNAAWSMARFGQAAGLLTGGRTNLRVRRLELGRVDEPGVERDARDAARSPQPHLHGQLLGQRTPT
jgi:hypothetical protein